MRLGFALFPDAALMALSAVNRLLPGYGGDAAQDAREGGEFASSVRERGLRALGMRARDRLNEKRAS